MRRLALILIATSALACGPSQHHGYPVAPRGDVVDTLHGTRVPDPYRWLENADDARVQKWLNEEAALTRRALDARPERRVWFKKLDALSRTSSISPPTHRGGRYFYTRRHADKEKRIFYWKDGADGEEHVLLDPHTLSPDGSTEVGMFSLSWDGKRVAYSVKKNNMDEAVLHVLEVDTGKTSDIDVIDGVNYTDASWNPEGTGFYYMRMPTDPVIPNDERLAHADVRFHRLGTDPQTDPVIREPLGDASKIPGVGLSRDGRWLFYEVYRGIANDIYVEDLEHPEGGFRTLVEGTDHRYEAFAWQDRIYMRTNDGAPRYRVVRIDPAHLDRKHWKTIVPEDARSTLTGIQIRNGRLIVSWLENAYTKLEVRTLDGEHVRDVELEGIGSASLFWGNPDEDEAYFMFYSFTTPVTIYKTSVSTGKTELWAKEDVPVDPSPYVVKQVWYPSKDGTKISMFLVHRKDLPLDGKNPTILRGYGGFTVSMSPWFDRWYFPWLERGGVMAVANLRGGGEYGEAWHEAGMLLKKQNVFDDFYAAAEWLVKSGYTRPESLAFEGGSNGGLLMGAAMTQRPELCAAIINSAPLLDMLRYPKFGVGKVWIPEYGDPDDPVQFANLLRYSPYHHVEQGTVYPALLLISPESDDRVDPMHARKMVAALQWAQGGPKPILLRVERKSGHGGGGLRSKAVEVNADIFTFLEWNVRMRDE